MVRAAHCGHGAHARSPGGGTRCVAAPGGGVAWWRSWAQLPARNACGAMGLAQMGVRGDAPHGRTSCTGSAKSAQDVEVRSLDDGTSDNVPLRVAKCRAHGHARARTRTHACIASAMAAFLAPSSAARQSQVARTAPARMCCARAARLKARGRRQAFQMCKQLEFPQNLWCTRPKPRAMVQLHTAMKWLGGRRWWSRSQVGRAVGGGA